MTRVVVVVAVALAGCYPKSTTTTRTISHTTSEPVVDRLDAVELRIWVEGTKVVVGARLPRWCHRDITDAIETTSEHHVALLGQDPLQTVVLGALLVLAYPLGIADVVVTGAVTLASRDTATTKDVTKRTRFPCPTPAANTTIRVTLASGKTVDGVIDATGVYTSMLPPGEPEGQVMVRVIAPGAPPDALAPAEIVEGINPVRDAIVACGPRARIGGPLGVHVTVNGAGRITKFAADRGGVALNACLGSALAAARLPASRDGGEAVLQFELPHFAPIAPPSSTAPIAARDPEVQALADKAYERARNGKCASASALGHAIRDRDPDYYAHVFVVDPAIVGCLH